MRLPSSAWKFSNSLRHSVSVSEESSRQRNLSFVIRILDVIEGHERPGETERFE